MRGSINNSHAQTYSVFDNSDFKIAKEIYYELQQELENEKNLIEIRKLRKLDQKERALVPEAAA